MSNTITAFFKGRKGVCESVYQYDYGMVIAIDGIDFFTNDFDCYFSTTGQDEAIPVIGSDNRVAIPNECLTRAGDVTLHIPEHTGSNDSEVEYVVTFKVIGRAKPVDDGSAEEQSALSKAIALLNHTNSSVIETIDSYLDENAAEPIHDWLDEHPEATTTVQDGAISENKLETTLKNKINLNMIYLENICRLPYRRNADAAMQGGTCTENEIFYQYSAENSELLKFDLSTGNTIASQSLSLGHCNSMAFIERENKLLCYGTFGEYGLPYNRLTVIDGDSLEVVDRIDLDLPSGVSLENPVQSYGYMCAYDNDSSQLYIAGQRFIQESLESYIIKYDYIDGYFIFNEYSTLPESLATSATDMCFYEGKIYILTSDMPQIVVLDKTYNVVSAIPVNRIVSSLSYATEFESISIIDNEIIVGYRASCFKNAYGGGSYTYAKASISNSVAAASKSTPEASNQITLYVDNSNDNIHRDGSNSNPFNNIYEALNCVYNFDAVTIIDTSPNEDSFVIAVTSGQHVTINAKDSAVNYGIRMDGGYLYAMQIGHSAFSVNNADYNVYIENGAECKISVWNKTGGGADVALDNNTIYLNNGAKLGMYNSMLVNVDALIVGASCSVEQILDFAPNNIGLIRSDAPTNIRTKNIRGFRQSLNGNPSDYYIPIQCSCLLTVTFSGKKYYLSGNVAGNQLAWDINGHRIAIALARTNQWGKVTLGYESNVITVNSLDVWM